ncbi:MAG TPA: hypothetical protein VNZ22_03145, partial [Bacillota bacterium]|nr:hypothetical protein [Bacillota bacterium]
MLRRYWIWGTVLTMSGWLVVGCGSASAHRLAAKSRPTRAAVVRLPDPSGSSDWPAEKLAQAHAHYAAGVIHEMNEEPEAAL